MDETLLKKIKIFLIETPISIREYEVDGEGKYTIWLPPLWTLCLGTFLKKKLPEIHIEILDGQLTSFNDIKTQIIKVKPDIIGLSPKGKNYERTLRLARISKRAGVRVIMGGFYATGLAREIIKNRGPHSSDYCVDAVVRGDGEKAFFEYVGGKPLEKINNLVYQDRSGIKENPIEFLNLDKLPIPDLGLVKINNYFEDYQKRYSNLKGRKILRLYTQKGCHWRKICQRGCIFCSSLDGAIRTRAPSIIWREINNAIEIYGVNKINDVSELSFEDKDWFEKFYEQARKSRYPLPGFTTAIRTRIFEDLMVKKMRQININSITLGIESGDRRCLQRMNTGTTPEFARQTVKIFAKYGIKMTLRFIVGAPGETKETLRKTVRFAKELSKFKEVERMIAKQLTPIPGSYVWDLLLTKTGNKYRDSDIINFREAQLDWQKYFCVAEDRILGQAANTINQMKYYL